MSKQTFIENNNKNIGVKPYRFTFNNVSRGPLVIEYAPGGWNKNELEVNRDKLYKGVLSTITIKEILLYKDVKDYVQKIYDTSGHNEVITVTIEAYDYNTLKKYIPYYEGIWDWTNYKSNQTFITGGFGITNFQTKIKSRDTNKVNLLSTKSIDGFEFTDFPLNEVKIPDTSRDNDARYEEGATAFITDATHVIPCTLITTNFTETQSQTIGAVINNKNSAFFKESTSARQLTIAGNVSGEFLGTSGTFDASIDVYINILDIDSNIVLKIGLGEQQQIGVTDMSFNFDFSELVTLQKDQSLILQADISPTTEKFSYSSVVFDVSESTSGSPEVLANGFLIYEMFLRCLQIITDTDDPLVSDTLGRTDTPLTQYDQDGEKSLLSVSKGEYFRQLNTGAFTTSYRDLFNAVNSLFPISASFETIDGVDKVRIELLENAYPSNVILDLSDQLRLSNIEEALNPDMIYTEIKIGYTKSEYEQTGGLFEYNTNSTFSTINKPFKNVFTSISKIRADYNGILKLINTEDDTEDVSSDNDNFFLTLKRDGDEFIALTDENFDFVGGSFYAFRSLNLDITPKRNMLANHDFIWPSGHKNLSSYFRWQASDKSTQLVTKKPAETTNLAENGDVRVNDLEESLFTPEKYLVKTYLTPSQRAIIINQNGLIKLATDKYGWVDNAKLVQTNGISDITLQKANLNRVKPS